MQQVKWRKTSRYSHQSDDGYTVAKFHIGADSVLGVTQPDGRKPAFFGDRAAVLEWIERHREGIMSGTE